MKNFNFEKILPKFKDEFIFYKDITTEEIDLFMYEGCLPMYESYYDIFAIKLHDLREILSPIAVRPGKTVKRNSKLYRIVIDYDFDMVYKGVLDQFGRTCWFTNELYDKIKPLILNENSLTSLHTFGVINKEDKLVAGDIGVVSGSRYLSMTGFCLENGAGTVLLYAIGKLLPRFGFDIWDLGMYLDYKDRLGAGLISREEFLDLVKKTRDKKVKLPKGIYECNEVIKFF